jgi:hypothetical protein
MDITAINRGLNATHAPGPSIPIDVPPRRKARGRNRSMMATEHGIGGHGLRRVALPGCSRAEHGFTRPHP